jgi:O-antigen/teichoic acid export membrane protein
MATAGKTETIAAASVARPEPARHGRGVRTIGQTILSRITIQGLNAVTGILTARLLLPTGRGELAAITLWSGFLAGLTTFGLPSSLIFHLRNRPQEMGKLLTNALLMSFFFSCVAIVIGFFGMPSWLHNYPAWAIEAGRWFLLVTPLVSLALILRGALEASGAFSMSNLAQILNPAATLAVLLLFWAAHRFNVITASCAYIFAAFPVFAMLAWKARKLVTAKVPFGIDASKLLLSYGIRSYGIDLLGTLALQVDQVIVVRYLAAAELGVYVVMLSLSRMLSVFQASVVTVLVPKAAGNSRETVVSLTERAARVGAVLTGSCALVVGVIGPFLLRVFYGPEYAKSVLSLRLLLAEVTLSGCVFVLSQAFMALGRPGLITILQALGLSLSLPIMIVLIPRWGIEGAACALLISTTARFLFIFFSFRFVLKTPLPDLVPKLEDFETLVRAITRMKGPKAA